jgi:DNA-binding NarL/FixJ family response regulator
MSLGLPAAVKVMLVDDHAIVREGYRRLLEAEGDLAVVAEAADAETTHALLDRLAAAGGVDVVVLDLSMPGRGGLDLARRLAIKWPAVRVLVFTMHDHPAMVAQALAAGVAGYITKTSAPQALVAALRRVAAGEQRVLGPDVQAAPADPTAQPPHMALSPREFDVLQGLVRGEPLDAIAQRLHISPKTVSNLQTLIRSKLGVSTAVELLRYAQQHRLFSP